MVGGSARGPLFNFATLHYRSIGKPYYLRPEKAGL